MCSGHTLVERVAALLWAIYQSIREKIINAPQQIAYWRSRIIREHPQKHTRSEPTQLHFIHNHREENSNNNHNNNSIDLLIKQSPKTQLRSTTHLHNINHYYDNTVTTVQIDSPRDENHKFLNPSSGHADDERQHLTLKQAASKSRQHLDGQGQPLFSTKTPRLGRVRLVSLFRRLSIRNFMEYCVIALNEASSSGCSNKFDLNSAEGLVWLLGRQYSLPRDATKLIEDIQSKIWVTYRRNFPPIDENTRYTTDRGFGCMIRCGQMVLANALIYKNHGRDWRWNSQSVESNPKTYLKILKLFQDTPQCQYSIHRIVQTGQQEGKEVGEWFGPNTIAQTLKRMAKAHKEQNNDDDTHDQEISVSIDAALDNLVVKDEIIARFKCLRTSKKHQQSISTIDDNQGSRHNGASDEKGPDQEDRLSWLPGVLFIQLRLGLSKINPLYFDALKKTFQFENSLGIIGGRPNHALYLIGSLNDDIIYLDPHCTQQYVDFDNPESSTVSIDSADSATSRPEPLDSTYHCSHPEKMPLDRLDPSLALCFYFHSESQFEDWCLKSDELLVRSEQAPMFEITETRELKHDFQTISRVIDSPPAGEDTSVLSNTEDDEFEMLG